MYLCFSMQHLFLLLLCFSSRIYRKIEFKSGPFLNLVLGPNGSGKSALVCAVILGFGGDPGLTGRSKDLSMF